MDPTPQFGGVHIDGKQLAKQLPVANEVALPTSDRTLTFCNMFGVARGKLDKFHLDPYLAYSMLT